MKIKYDSLDKGSKIEFIFDDETIEGKIKGGWVEISPSHSTIVFDKLGIKNPNDFVKDILGLYYSGIWPEVNSKEDLKQVLDALEAYPKIQKVKGIKPYITDIQGEFKEGKRIIFRYNDESFDTGVIHKTSQGYFIAVFDDPFKKLKISDKEQFVTDVLGYYIPGGFPYCKSIKDFKTLCKALFKANKEVSTKLMKAREEEAILILKVRKHKPTKFNFKL